MKKRRIVIASVLNPVNDTRVFEKMGISLAEQNDYEIFIIGQASEDIPEQAGIQFIPTKPVDRLSIGRVLLRLKVALNIIKVKPELLIVNTHELLIVSIVNRILFGCIIVYDIRENYYRNTRFSEGFPPWLRIPLALCVRLKEKLTAPLIHHFVIAEKTYENELTFIGSRFTVIENKAAVPRNFKRLKNDNSIHLLYSGTIAKSTGVFQAIDLAESLFKVDQSVTLTIIGFCALENLRTEIRHTIANKPFIKLVGFDQPVPHHLIVEEIMKANFGIIYYPPLPHTLGSIPTKLYEYLAFNLPILTWDDQTFIELITANRAGLLVTELYTDLLHNMRSIQFYPQPVEDVHWEGEKFKGLIKKLLQ